MDVNAWSISGVGKSGELEFKGDSGKEVTFLAGEVGGMQVILAVREEICCSILFNLTSSVCVDGFWLEESFC